MRKFALKHRFASLFGVLILLIAFATPLYAAGDTELVPPADRPTDCKGEQSKIPPNCLFLTEPIGGDIGYDLFTRTCIKPAGGAGDDTKKDVKCTYTYKLWHGENIIWPVEGPFQAILTFSPDSPDTGGLGLLYSYVSLIYKYLSGIIVSLVVLFIIIGGIQMTTSAGNQTAFDEGKKRITNALVGMVIWFLASLILYTINPTFFAF